MISAISLRNFKCFAGATLRLTHGLNVFAGANGTGKSTIAQALLVLFQSVRSGALAAGRLELNGQLVDLGTSTDVLYRRAENDEFAIVLRDAEEGRWAVTAKTRPSKPQHTLPAQVTGSPLPIRCLEGSLIYLSADRLAPQRSYPIYMPRSNPNVIGKRGEFAPLLYHRTRKRRISNEALLLENEDGSVYSDLGTQFNLWMNRLFPGFAMRTERLEQLDAVMLGLNMQGQTAESEYLRPTNVGFGVMIALPIVLGGLMAARRSTVIFENPEAHLHPAAQSMIGEFLARVAVGGAQVLIETHSDHMINGIRLAYKNRLCSQADLRFFSFEKEPRYGAHSIVRVRIDKSGEFQTPPDQFFDQGDKDLRLLLGI
jgi:predicted ATPase